MLQHLSTRKHNQPRSNRERQSNKALEFRSEKDDPSGKGISLNNIANCYAQLGEKQKALHNYLEAVRLHRLAQNQRQLAITLKGVGVFYRDEGQPAMALETLNEARTISATIGDQSTEANVLSELARLEFANGNLTEALKLIEQATIEQEAKRFYRLLTEQGTSVPNETLPTKKTARG